MILCIQESVQAGGRQKKKRHIKLHSRYTPFIEIHASFLRTRHIFIKQNQQQYDFPRQRQTFGKKTEWIICLRVNCIQNL